MAVVAVATTAIATVGQIQQANHQADAINHQNDVRQHEIDQASTAEINDRLRQARRDQGRIMVAAGESGLSLDSGGVENLLLDNAMQAELSNDRSLANRESRKLSTAADAQAAMPSKPTLLGAGLQIGLAGAKAYMGAQGSTAAAHNAGGG